MLERIPEAFRSGFIFDMEKICVFYVKTKTGNRKDFRDNDDYTAHKYVNIIRRYIRLAKIENFQESSNDWVLLENFINLYTNSSKKIRVQA